MKKIVSVIFVLCFVFAFAGCGKSGEAETSADGSTSPAEAAADSSNEQTSGKVKSAVVYFSATGTTESIAKLIASETGSDIYKIIPTEEYTDSDLDYNNDESRANTEMNDPAARPEIYNDLSMTEEYDVIYLGYPIWWGTAPRIIQTYLESYDLSGAKIYTFCTSGSSGIEASISDLQTSYPNLNIISGKRLNGAIAEDIDEWIQGL